VPKVDGGDESTRASVGVAAARYFEKTTKENSKITLASGITLSKMVESLTFRKFSNLKLFPLSVTDGSTIVNGFSANSSVAKMKAKYGGDIRAFDFRIAPVLKDLEWQEKLRILEERGIKDHFEEAENADVFLLEISSLKYMRPEIEKCYEYYGIDVSHLKEKAVGEINYLLFDSTHILTEDEFPASKRIISITLERLKKVSKEPSKHVIALASTTKEIDAVKASLFPDVLCYDILIIDEELARGIMKG
jgi:DNA-binding transcriptional regulator LsrR (DeoR family)